MLLLPVQDGMADLPHVKRTNLATQSSPGLRHQHHGIDDLEGFRSLCRIRTITLFRVIPVSAERSLGFPFESHAILDVSNGTGSSPQC